MQTPVPPSLQPVAAQTAPDAAPPITPPARRRMAALGIVGSAMVAVPLVQVLRYESAEMQAVVAQQASLDPIARAVAVQYSLLAHRDTAGLVLRGQAVLEPERQLRQGEVDDRLIELGTTLDTLHSYRAVDEAQVLAKDWAELAEHVSRKKISADASDAAHRLRVEQAVQVMDLVADAGGLTRHADAAAYLKSAKRFAAAAPKTAAAPAAPAARSHSLQAEYQTVQAHAQAVQQNLAQQQATLQRQQRTLWALMAGLAALAAGLAASGLRALHQPMPQPLGSRLHAAPEAAMGDGQTALRAETDRALAVLRQPVAAVDKDPAPPPKQKA